jgi:hypothetical protein
LTDTEGGGGTAFPEPTADTEGQKKRRIHRPAPIAGFPKLFWHPSSQPAGGN